MSILATMSKEITHPAVQNEEISPEILLRACGDDIETVRFFVEWLKTGRNATDAYRNLHPDANDHSCRILGSRALAKVDKTLLLQAYGLNAQKYIEKLNEGLEAYKINEFTGDIAPDFRARKAYHDKLGQLLKWESKNVEGNINIQTIVVVPFDLANKYKSTDIIGSTEEDSKQQ